MIKYTEIIRIIVVYFVIVFFDTAMAVENPDELYRQGHFKEAEKVYAQMDMDYPKDLRFRYNRGCAAYQNSDYQIATAAFSSVLRRAEDKEVLFKAAYNLGNTFFKQGDFETAAAYYQKAITFNPESEEAKYNFELSLREQEKQENNQVDQKQIQKDPSASQKKTNKTQNNFEEECLNNESQPEMSEQKSSQSQGQSDKKGHLPFDKENRTGQKKEVSNKDQKSAQESSKDLSGDLQPLQGVHGEKDEEDDTADTGQKASAVDIKKAEALLDNLREDRSHFMRFQVPEEKRYGPQSGKKW